MTKERVGKEPETWIRTKMGQDSIMILSTLDLDSVHTTFGIMKILKEHSDLYILILFPTILFSLLKTSSILESLT